MTDNPFEHMEPKQQALLEGLFQERDVIDKLLKDTPPLQENRKKIFSLNGRRDNVVRAINSIIFSSDKEYADEEFGYQVFKYIADNPQMDNGKRENIKAALESARIACKKDKEWVEDVRGNGYLFTKKNLEALASNGDLALLMKFNTLKKRNIVNKSTLNSAAGEFSDQKSLAERLQDHTQRIKELERCTKKLDKKSRAQEAHTKVIDSILGDRMPEWKVSAAMLKNQGFTQEDISSALGVSLRTVKTYWKSLE